MSIAPPDSILVIRAGAVGDFVLTIPVVDSLRAAYPGSDLAVAGHPDRVALIADRVDAVLDVNDAAWASLFVPDTGARSPLIDRIRRTDLIVSFIPDPDEVVAANLRRISRGLVLARSPHPPGAVHVTDHLLRVLDPLGIPVWSRPALDPGPPPSDAPSSPFAVIHPGSGGRHKVWPTSRFAEVGRRLAGRMPVVVTSGPADEDIVDALLHDVPDAIRRTPRSLTELAALCGAAALYIGNDSGPTHLAAAVGTPTVAIFGPTDPDVWGPRGDRVEIVAGGGTSTRSPVESVPVTSVLKAANRLFPLEI